MKQEHQTNDPIESFKNQFFKPDHAPGMGKDWVHFNNAGVAPISRAALESVKHWSNRMFETGIQAVAEMTEESEKARKDVAEFMGCKPRELSFMPSCAAAISQVALGLKLDPGDEIIIWDQEYPSNFYPWRVAAERSGAKLVVATSAENLGTPVELLIQHVTPKTKVIAFSWVQYRTGAITDLERISAFARSKGIFTCADVIQGVGLMPFDFSLAGVDAACGGSHKWLVSPIGCGTLSIREEHLEAIAPVTVGAITYGTPEEGYEISEKLSRQPKADSQRFEPGSKGFLEIMALSESIRMIKRTGIDRINQQIEFLSGLVIDGLHNLGYKIHAPQGKHHHRHGSIVNFSPGPRSPLKTVDAIAERLTQERIRAAVRPPGVRLSPHAFNTPDEVDFVIQTLKAP